MTNEDIQRALDGYKRGKDNRDLTTWFACYESLIVQCLTKALEPDYKAIADEMAEALKYIIRRYWEEHEILDVDRFNELDEVKMAKQALAKWEEIKDE